jgi:hypothetical protein
VVNRLDFRNLLFWCWIIPVPRNYEGNIEEEKTVPSSSNEIFTDQLGVWMMVRGRGEEGVTPPAPHPFYSRLPNRYLKGLGHEIEMKLFDRNE